MGGMMKKIALITAFVTVFLCLNIFISCSNKKYEEIVFDNSHPLALAPDVSWAVIKDPYAAYKTEPNWSADAKGHCRKGEILQVIGKSVDEKNDVWYSFENGWLPANSLSIFNNRYKAQTAAQQFGE